METVAHRLVARGARDPDAVAIIEHRDGATRELTFGRWAAKTEAVAATLARRGVGRGSVVALGFGDHSWLEFAIAVVATQHLGAVGVAPTPDAENAFQAFLRDRAAVDAGDDLGALAEAGRDLPRRAPVLVRCEDVSHVVSTSGSEGAPKLVEVPHANYLHWSTAAPRLRRAAPAGPRLSRSLPGTQAAYAALLHPLSTGSPIHVALHATPEALLAALGRHVVDHIALTPTSARLLLPRLGRDPSVAPRKLTLSGEVAGDALLTALREHLPDTVLVNAYTTTEAMPAVCEVAYRPGDRIKPGSVGRPWAGCTVAIRPPAVRPGVGVICMATAGAVTRRFVDGSPCSEGGEVCTGDVGYVDADGDLIVLGRAGQVVALGRRRITLTEVDQALEAHVADALAFAPAHGDGVECAVVLEPGGPGPAALREALAGRFGVDPSAIAVHPLPRLATDWSGKASRWRTRALVHPRHEARPISSVCGVEHRGGARRDVRRGTG